MLFSKNLIRPRSALLGGVIAVLLVLAGCVGGRQLWAGYHLRVARKCLNERDFQGASEHLATCLAVWPDDVPTRLLAASSARRAERYDDAEEHLRRCRALRRDAPEVTQEEALLSVQRGKLGDAESYLRRTIGPENRDAPLVLEALACGYVKTDRLASLLECTDLWLHVSPENSQALRWRGYAWARFLDLNRAVDCYERAVAADALNDDARLALGLLLIQRLNRPQDALDQFECLRQRRPEDSAVLLGLVRCYHQLNRLKEAQDILAAVLARQPQMADALGERGKLALEAGQLSEAEGWLRDAVGIAADDREAHYNLIRCLHAQGKAAEASTLQTRVDQLDVDLARLDALISAIGKAPNVPSLRSEAGLICLRYGKDQEGLRWLLSALEADPGHEPTHTVLADYYERRGDPRRAEAERRLARQRMMNKG
jgi:tetratricopeptide (TPR) repeat protein